MDDRKLLIIWEEVPENTYLYLVPWEVYLENQKVIDGGAGHFVHHEDDDGAVELYKLISTAEAGDDSCIGTLDHYRLSDEDKRKPVSANIQKVVLSGFVL